MVVRMRRHVPALALLGLAACVSPDYAPDAGVGFQSYDRYMQQQAAAAPAMPMSTEAPASGAASIAADTMAALRGPTATTPAAPAPVVAPPPAQVAPPSTGAAGTNIAAFALATSHPVGQQMYRRSNPFRRSAFDRACARYPSDALAQEAFLAAGGPGRDRHGLDPDGDGYACRWDPAPFRLARQAR